ncbi:serine/threonine protein kinase [Fusarium bulbicola]|nr:serine/threonine protein kinase [Fusarium bulbicola]
MPESSLKRIRTSEKHERNSFRPVPTSTIEEELWANSPEAEICLGCQGQYFALAYNDSTFATLSKGLSTLISSLISHHQLHIQAYVPRETGAWEGDLQDIRIGSNLPIELNIYGSRQDAEYIGRTLSRAGIYLQFPLCGLEDLEYYNPHFFRMEGYPNQVSIPASVLPRMETFVDPLRKPQQHLRPPFIRDSGLQKKFCSYVESKLVNGVNGHGETVAYVPGSDLENYWSEANVDNILDSHDWPIQENSTYITRNLRHVFSTLVYTGHMQQISWFCQHVRSLSDLHLPFSVQDLPTNCTWSKGFIEHQWKFCPLSFTPDTVFKRNLHPKHILPVVYEECLTDSARPSGAATLWRVHIQSECTLPLSKAGTVVFKIYEGAGAQRFYEAETQAYSRLLRSNNEGYTTKHFMSFSFQGIERSNIVPVTLSEYCLLWSRLLSLFDALQVLHDISRSATSSDWSLVHHDIQLSNILVFPQKDERSRFDVHFKLADFGLAKIGRTSSSEDSLMTRKKGDRMYNLSPSSDIWSLGAVFSDILVWSIEGESGRENYRLKRQEEISNKPHLRAAKYDACFHDGTSRLTAVDEFHNSVLQHKRGIDHISPYMSQLIIEFMLTDRHRRLNPIQLKLRADEMIKIVLSGQWEDIPITKSLVPEPPSTLENKGLPIAEETPTNTLVTVDQIYQLLKQKDRVSLFFSQFNAVAEIKDLPGMQEAYSKYAEAKERDQIILVDNFSSMGEYKPKAMEMGRVISYLMKRSDALGIEVFAASETEKPQICTTSTNVERAIGKMKTVQGTCNMGKCLDGVLNQVLRPGQFRPTSIYIFTDGVWEPGHDRVTWSINRAIDFLHDHGYKSSALMFQFIRFGNDAEGIARLDVLATKCKRSTGTDFYNVVDTRHCDEHIPDIILGSISRSLDLK